MNCFGIPNAYMGYTIHQGPDDRFYGLDQSYWEEEYLEGDTWDELREIILGRVESNASGTMWWESVRDVVAVERHGA
jgi:hypothetical protein